MAENSFTETLKTLGPARLAIMGGVIVAMIGFFIFISMRVSEPTMSILYSDLTTMDSSSIAGKLQESTINFRISPDGTKVFVPDRDIGQARMLLAENGLPNGGSMGYEIFEKQSGFGSTTFMQNLNNKRALEGELARTISSLDQIVMAKVHIVLPQRELFAREARDASASVTLKLNPAARLNKKQIYAVQNLVANAVPELQARSVTILDNEANLLAGGDMDDSAEGIGGLKAEEMQRSFENRLAQQIEDLVGRVVGINNVRATVTADLDFDRISTNSEIYDPEGQVLRSTQLIEETGTERDADQNNTVSVNNNLPGLNALGGAGATITNENNRIEEVLNYEISKTIQSTIRESGEVNKLSVAVIVDGVYTTDEEGIKTYNERSAEQMDKITALIRSAMGYDEARGDTLEVANLPFAEVSFDEELGSNLIFGFSRKEILETVQMMTLGIMLILVIVLVIRPILSQLFASVQEEIDNQEPAPDPLLEAQQRAQAALEAPQQEEEEETMIDMQQVEGKVKASTVKKVGEIVESHPNETVSVIRQWMNSD